jgi:hypothetical protein
MVIAFYGASRNSGLRLVAQVWLACLAVDWVLRPQHIGKVRSADGVALLQRRRTALQVAMKLLYWYWKQNIAAITDL